MLNADVSDNEMAWPLVDRQLHTHLEFLDLSRMVPYSCSVLGSGSASFQTITTDLPASPTNHLRRWTRSAQPAWIAGTCGRVDVWISTQPWSKSQTSEHESSWIVWLNNLTSIAFHSNYLQLSKDINHQLCQKDEKRYKNSSFTQPPGTTSPKPSASLTRDT